jgi:hypothetical protein
MITIPSGFNTLLFFQQYLLAASPFIAIAGLFCAYRLLKKAVSLV